MTNCRYKEIQQANDLEYQTKLMSVLLRLFSVLLSISFVYLAFAQNTLQINEQAVIRTHPGAQMAVYGDVVNNGNFGDSLTSNQGELHFSGSALQNVTGDSTIQFDSIVIIGDEVNLDLELRVAKHLIFTEGNITSDRADSAVAFLHFLDNADYSGSSDASHVDGTARKTGNDGFIFPVGQNGNLQPIAISAPAQVSDHFTAFYRQVDPSSYSYSTTSIDSNCGGSPVMVDITEQEYWQLDRTGGSSSVEVTLYYDASSGVNTPAEIMVARWDGAEWESMGNGGLTGNASDGTIVTGNGCGTTGSSSTINVFGPFTLSASTITAVPVKYIYFDVVKYDDTKSLLKWATATEINNSHFEIERSANGTDFYPIGLQEGFGNSTSIHSYQFIDSDPINGINYYRIKQVDFNGEFEYTEVKYLIFNGAADHIGVYPIPANNLLNVDLTATSFFTAVPIKAYDQMGRLILDEMVNAENKLHKIDVSYWSAGVYFLYVNNNPIKIIKQ